MFYDPLKNKAKKWTNYNERKRNLHKKKGSWKKRKETKPARGLGIFAGPLKTQQLANYGHKTAAIIKTNIHISIEAKLFQFPYKWHAPLPRRLTGLSQKTQKKTKNQGREVIFGKEKF